MVTTLNNEHLNGLYQKEMSSVQYYPDSSTHCRFISKYHPKNVNQSKETDAANLQSRVKAFLFLLESGSIDSVSISMDNSEDIIKMMDSGLTSIDSSHCLILAMCVQELRVVIWDMLNRYIDSQINFAFDKTTYISIVFCIPSDRRNE